MTTYDDWKTRAPGDDDPPPDARDEQRCDACGGLGCSQVDARSPCPVCSGRGYLEREPEERDPDEAYDRAKEDGGQ